MAIGIRPPNPRKSLKKVFLWVIIIVTLLNCTPELGLAEESLNCDELECISGISRELNQSSCPEGTIYQEKVALNGCCPACVKFLNLDEDCEDQDDQFQIYRDNITEINGIFTSPECAPGLSCQMDMDTQYYTCRPVTGKCDSYQYLPEVLWKPACDPNGDFSSVQRKGETSSVRHFCYNPEGKRIFGQALETDVEEMTCACSREVASIEAAGHRSDVSLHCNEWGNYEHLQCDDGLCWCSDTKTGVPQAVAVPSQMSKLLPCYLEEEIGSQYFRECESAVVAASHIKDILIKHGTINTNLEVDKCDPDGSYGSYQILKDQVHCTWKDKTFLNGYACPIDHLKTINCNCAWDEKLYKLHSRRFSLLCSGNGNYRPTQFSQGNSYCVDSDGFAITGLFDNKTCSSF